MKKLINKKIYRIFLLVVLVVIVVGTIWYIKNEEDFSHLVSRPQDVKMWQADPRPLQSEKAVIKQTNKLNLKNKGQDVSLKSMELVVIPGLRGAWSINPKTKKAAFGDDWIPQGVTQSDDNYYISVYDGDYHLDSLIFQIDKKTKKYVKTIILNSKAHVGGIVYDEKYKQLIYSNDTSKSAGFGYLSKTDMDAYHAEKVKAPIHSKEIKWPIGSRTSAITLYNNQLLVAKYGSNKNDRSIVAVPLDSKGFVPVPSNEELTKLDSEMTQESSKTKDSDMIMKKYVQILVQMKLLNSWAPAWDRLQGIAVSKIGVTLLTQSNGQAPGKLWVQLPKKGTDSSRLDYIPPTTGVREISIPASVEGISLDSSENQIALVFESGAKKYRKNNSLFFHSNYMDRLMILPISISGNKNN